ncbi:hypothetical protein GGR44_000359 [Sphingobium fontiphilum]|uniref:DUF306 domain-containing protein n=1 Tax=Sphingobium fontiphilum TaxID=944425 RepID=A0A7W6DJ07_9SPHN|nr:hypothetical protein [Sphingobium fontiphilum]MBB3980728.1 hypothetical protein [Sphingobium fontiphilum]
MATMFRIAIFCMIAVFPTPILAQPAPPPQVVAMPRTMTSPIMVATIPVRVTLSMGPDILWSGNLLVGRASARVSIQEAADNPASCDGETSGSETRSIEITIGRYQVDRLSVSARYSRPADDKACPRGTRQISIQQQLVLTDGEAVLDGDGGLRLTLSREQRK